MCHAPVGHCSECNEPLKIKPCTNCAALKDMGMDR